METTEQLVFTWTGLDYTHSFTSTHMDSNGVGGDSSLQRFKLLVFYIVE